MTYSTILYDVSENILTITLNRPDKLNAFNETAGAEFLDALERGDNDDDVKAIIVTGAGRAFCAGADLSEKGASTFELSDTQALDMGDEKNRDGGGLLTLRIFECKKPVIAAVNGPAVGMGATLILAMDFRLASESARFGFVFARRGIVPESCCSWFLPRIVGISQALEWCYPGRVFDAREALEKQLVTRVFNSEELLDQARAFARALFESSAPVSIALTRQMMWRMLGADHPMEAHKIDSRGLFARGAASDAKEGIAAFLEKRPARFPNTVSRDMPKFYPWWRPRKYE